MSKMDRATYEKVKHSVDKCIVLDKGTVNWLRGRFGFSETTFRRVLKSVSYMDYKSICSNGSRGNKTPIIKVFATRRKFYKRKLFLVLVIIALVAIGIALLPILAMM